VCDLTESDHQLTDVTMAHSTILTSEAIFNRNLAWKDNPNIPSWVDLDTVGLDQFFTTPAVANYCNHSLMAYMRADGAVTSDYQFVEPSAGSGAFYDLLPRARRIGLDVMPLREEFLQQDFLSWNLRSKHQKFAVIGNPPFGYRAWLALAFVNHAANFADYVGMILPMAFQSDGKGSPKHRVSGLTLVHSEYLPADSFTDPFGKVVKVNGLWQIWKKGENSKENKKKCRDWLELFTVDQRKERLCGQNRLSEAAYFLQRTFFNEPPTLVKSFAEVKYVCGYGIVLKKEKNKIKEVLKDTNWREYSNLAAHNCRHISMYHIEKAVTDAGYIDA
jgi:hypothetical protein